MEIINNKFPEFSETAKNYNSQKENYLFNMFIMKKEIFNNYCNWLFSILQEAETKINIKDYDDYQSRVMGFLSERLTGIYITYLKNQGKKIKELPVLFYDKAPE